MYSAFASYTLACPAGMTGASVTEGASAESIVSQRDADVKALTLAEALAYEFLVCANPVVPPAATFLSDPVTASAYSQPGYVVQTFTVSYSAGAVYSLLSKVEANAQAQLQAQADADHLRDTRQKLIFYNTAQSYTFSCEQLLAGGTQYVPLTYTATVAAGAYSSNTSQAGADYLAHLQAKALVESYLITNCIPIYYSERVSYTATCSGGLVGDPVTVTYAAGAYTSNVSLVVANAAALAAATAAATALIVCTAGYYNASQVASATCLAAYGPGWDGSTASAAVSAGVFHDTTLSLANSKALSTAVNDAVDNLRCTWTGGLLP